MAVDFSKIPSPSYVLVEEKFRKNLEIIKSVKERSGAEIILAFKGFAMWSAFPIVKEYIKGTTSSSEYEAKLSFEEMGVRTHTYCPAYTSKNIDPIIEYSSHITFNSLSQYKSFHSYIKQKDSSISLGIRVNPEFSEVTTELYNPCAPGSRFGLTIDRMPEVLPDDIEGIHFHTLCESGAEDLQKTLMAFESKFGKYLKQVKWVNFGGGHLMTRKGYNVDLFIELIRTFKEKYGVHVILEPGAAFAWDTGYLVSTIIDIVEDKGIKTAILDVSFTAHMPDCLEMPYKPVILGAQEPQAGLIKYRMGGNSCLSGDYMGDWGFSEELKPGMNIVFNDMIHYTMVKTTTFNGVQHPSIGIWTNEENFRLVREFGYLDFKNRLS